MADKRRPAMIGRAPIGKVVSALVPADSRPGAILLIGAGSSVRSGVPLSGELVERAGKWAYCLETGRTRGDPGVKRSDWWPWLQRQTWYDANASREDNYSSVVENGLRPRAERRDFLRTVVHPDVPPSQGIKDLCQLVADGLIETVLTPNFDTVLVDHLRTLPQIRFLEVIRVPADFDRIASDPADPQVVYLHGSVDHYTDQNLIDEVEHLHPDLLAALRPLLHDHAIVVVGYRGAEPSIMRDLLRDPKALEFRQGLYWCALPTTISAGLHPSVVELAEVINGNFHLVEIEGFDELMAAVLADARRRGAMRPSRARPGGASRPTFELGLVPGSTEASINWDRALPRLATYCERMGIAQPTALTRQWATDRLCAEDLCAKDGTAVRASNAAILLFGIAPQEVLSDARVVLRVEGEPDHQLGGDLWQQLDAVLPALAEANAPYLLKGAVNESVTPYPSLALKEIVVNALVHRDYSRDEPVVVEVAAAFIRVANPGGLLPEVRDRLGGAPAERLGRPEVRGLKAYRNPAIADLFYGAKQMEKEGSGLADVKRLVEANNGRVVFELDETTDAFAVTLFRRPEQVDLATRTAVPTAVARFATNLLEVETLPEAVWEAPALMYRRTDIWNSHRGQRVPPFVLHGGNLLTFAPLVVASSLFIRDIDPTGIRERSRSEFEEDPDEQRLLVQLLNECLYGHLRALGLGIDMRRKRAYFPRSEKGVVEVSYQARLRRSARTVTKPVLSRTTQLVRYWEHQSFEFGFERFGSQWALQIVPGYVFTFDGRRGLLEGQRVTRLATQRASRDYNPQVHNDLYFWTQVLSRGDDVVTLDCGGDTVARVRASLIPAEARREEPLPADDAVMALEPTEEDAASPEATVSELEEEVAELAEELRKETDEPNEG